MAILNKAALNTLAHVFVQEASTLISFGDKSGIRIAVLYNGILVFLALGSGFLKMYIHQ